ncbi:hypothetical protein C7S18_10160 [Ahniella affigens]|uniref:Transposase InsH N-terminal domain-containing protein n=1 Tax=Ahniella affigens TaxID=2021234 RepID=A0A2P1PRQ7_9GAMM|nr:hypothetical protein C7S18_10160 [Ahniella affigens]
MDQISFGDAECAVKKKQTRREISVAQMERVIPWQDLYGEIAAFYPSGGRGRTPYPTQSISSNLFLRKV